jgi:hypothetical protein
MKRRGPGHACAGLECPNRVPQKHWRCERCKRVERELSELVRRLLFPPPQPYTPRVVAVVVDDTGRRRG